MNFLNRAIKNSTRKMSKTVLLALTFFVIGNFVIVGLGISNAAEQAQIQTRMKMRAVVEISVDWSMFWDEIDELELSEEEENQAYEDFQTNHAMIAMDEVNALLEDERVKAINSTTMQAGYSIDFDAVPIGNERELEQNNTQSSCYVDEDGVEICEEWVYIDPAIMFKSNIMPTMIEFEDGIYELVEGRMYTQEEVDNGSPVVLITDTLAAYNNLRIGDTITLSSLSNSDIEGGYFGGLDLLLSTEDVYFELEIIGIFNNTEEIDPTAENFDWMSSYESPENVVLFPTMTFVNSQIDLAIKIWEAEKLAYPDSEYYQDEDNKPSPDDIMDVRNVIVLLHDPLKVDEFVSDYEVSSEGMYRTVDANNEVFEELSRPLETIGLFANFIVWLVVINAIIIITLVTALTLKTREYEIGVLLSQGVTKFKIVAQFFVELALVAVIGFTVAIASGMMIAGQVGETVLSYQVDSSGLNEEQEDDYYYGGFWGLDGYFTDIELDDIVSEYEVEISPIIILQIYVAGLGIVLISILIPSMMVMRFNPKRILMSSQ